MTNRYPAVAYGITARLEYANRPGMLGKITSAIGEVGGDISAVDLVQSTREVIARDFAVNARAVAREVASAAHRTGVAQRTRRHRLFGVAAR